MRLPWKPTARWQRESSCIRGRSPLHEPLGFPSHCIPFDFCKRHKNNLLNKTYPKARYCSLKRGNFIRVFSHRLEHQVVRDVVEEALDVEIDNPVRFPAMLPHFSVRVMGGLRRAIPIAVLMEPLVEHPVRDAS